MFDILPEAFELSNLAAILVEFHRGSTSSCGSKSRNTKKAIGRRTEMHAFVPTLLERGGSSPETEGSGLEHVTQCGRLATQADKSTEVLFLAFYVKMIADLEKNCKTRTEFSRALHLGPRQ